jgi:Brp/Blh family beta-carotene 15,15'-monooxygenase
MKPTASIETGLFATATALAILALWMGLPAPGAQLQAILLAIGVALIGLPHGALDPLIAARAGMLAGWRAMAYFHLAYVFAAALMLGFWLVAPVLALLLFLAYSALHFAGDWLERPLLMRFALGASLLGMPAYGYANEVADIYALLSGDAARPIAMVQHMLTPLWLTIIAAAAVTFLLRGRHGFVLELITVLAAAIFLPPLLFFLIYFCMLHSPRHFLAIWRASPDRRKAMQTAAGYTLLTLLVAIPLALHFAQLGGLAASLQQIVFIGLAALTVPHMILTSILEHRRHV